VAVFTGTGRAGVEVLMMPELLKAFKSIAVSTACGKKRTEACDLLDFMDHIVNTNGGIIQAADEALGDRVLINLNDVGEIFQNLICLLQAGGATVTPKNVAGAGVAALAYFFYELYEEIHKMSLMHL
jgi:hypothetical protein